MLNKTHVFITYNSKVGHGPYKSTGGINNSHMLAFNEIISLTLSVASANGEKKVRVILSSNVRSVVHLVVTKIPPRGSVRTKLTKLTREL